MKEYIIKNNIGVFFIGFFISMADDIFLGKYILTITGFIIMLFSFYLMFLKSQQKKSDE